MKRSSSSSESPSGHASGGDCSGNGTMDRYSSSASNAVPRESPAAGAPAAHRTLADTISGLRFDPADGLTAAHYGLVFGRCRPSIFDTLITDLARRRDYSGVIRAKRVSELAGYDSPVIASCLKEALSETEMLGFLPRTPDREGEGEGGFFEAEDEYRSMVQLQCVPAEALAALTSLEIRGLVVQTPGKVFHRAHPASVA